MIRVGPAGWSYADWEGRVYPRTKPPGFHPLAHIARFFDLVELNSSFYATPSAEHARNWVRLVADRPDFRFTAKLERVFTHDAWPVEPELARCVDGFRAGLAPLAEAGRLQALLAQFPLSFRRSPAGERRLARIAEHFGDLRVVLELRHASWFVADALRFFEAHELGLALIDLPTGPLHPPADAPALGPLAYLRLHGRNAAAWFEPTAGRDQRYDYLYGPDEVAHVVRTVRRLSGAADETAVVTNNHFSGKAVANALEIMAAIGDDPPLAPVELREAFPRLRATTRPFGQSSLF